MRPPGRARRRLPISRPILAAAAWALLSPAGRGAQPPASPSPAAALVGAAWRQVAGEPAAGDVATLMKSGLALPGGKGLEFWDAVRAGIRALPAEARPAALVEVLRPVAFRVVVVADRPGEAEEYLGWVEALSGGIGEADPSERNARLICLGMICSREAFGRLAAVLGGARTAPDGRRVAGLCMLVVLRQDMARRFLQEEDWAAAADALLVPDLPDPVRLELLEGLRDLANKPGFPGAIGRLRAAPDPRARRMGVLLALWTLPPAAGEAEAERLFSEATNEDSMRDAGRTSDGIVRLLRRVPEGALAGKAAWFLDDPAVTAGIVEALAARAASPGPLREALLHPPPQGAGAGRPPETLAAWTAAGSLAGIPQAAAEAAKVLGAGRTPALDRLLALLRPDRPGTAARLPAALSPALLRIASNPEIPKEARLWAIRALERTEGPAEASSIESLALDAGTPVQLRAEALELLGQSATPRAVALLGRLARSADPDLGTRAASLLAGIDSREATEALEALAKESPAGGPARDARALAREALRARPVEAERCALSGAAAAVPWPSASGGRAVRLRDVDARIEGKLALGRGAWRIRVEGFAQDDQHDGAFVEIGGREFRFFYRPESTNYVLDLFVEREGEYPFAIRTNEPGVAIDRITVAAGNAGEEEIRRALERLPRQGTRWYRFASLDPPNGTQLGILGAAAEAGGPIPEPPTDRPAAIAAALAAAKGKGEVLWSKADPQDPNALWVALRGRFVTLYRLSGDAPEDFSTFVEMAIGDAVTASSAAFGKDAVWVGTDRGLFRWTRATRGWEVVPVGKDAALGASVSALSLRDTGHLDVTLADGSRATLNPDGTWAESAPPAPK